MIAPAVGAILLVALFPLAWTVWESLHLHDLRMPWLGRPFIGLGNYLEAMSDPRFWAALAHTGLFAVVSVSLELLLGTVLALAMNRAFRGRGLMRASVLVPWAMPTVVSGLLWKFMFDGDAGIANAVLVKVGVLDHPIVWFIQTGLAWVPVVLADVWKTTPFVALLLLAGLQNIDRSLYEAARIDGASAWRQFRFVTLPLLAARDSRRPHLPDTRCLPGVRPHLCDDGRRPGNLHRADRSLHLQRAAAIPALRLRLGSLRHRLQRDLRARAPLHQVPWRRTHGDEGVTGEQEGRARWAAVAVLMLVLATAFPFYWAIVSSFTPESQLYRSPSLVPTSLVLDHYRALFAERAFWVPIRNSLIVAGTTTAFCVTVGALCAYALARLRFRGKVFLLGLILAVSMFPQISVVSPLFLLLRALHLINTYPGLILPYLTFAMPLTVWLLVGIFRQLPAELEEAAMVDGASRIRTFREVVVPLALPGLATTAILTFVYSWNEFLFALSFTLGPERQTVPVAIALLRGQYQVPWGQILAGSIIATTPVALLVLAFQRRIVQGLTAGAVKG